ncbi:MAG TPA: hypothetical protein ENJ22_00760 [Gammaproteobacteria bacterium]|nr:hypothetical protein [Gammaproteobacteria bacterium]
MQAFASFILRGRAQALLVAAIAAVLALLVPLLSHVSGGVIALVTLRKGFREGLIILAGLGLILGVIGYFSTVSLHMVKAFLVSTVIIVGLPVVLSAEVLRLRRSMGDALAVTALLSVAVLVGFYMVVGDAAGWWRGILETILVPVLENAPMPVTGTEQAQIIGSVAAVMSGLMVAAIAYSTMINLFIGRWLQAMLFNPGGFREEFHALRLGRPVAIFAVVAIVLAAVASGGIDGFAVNLLIVAVAVFSIHGLAMIHGVVGLTQAHKGWLYALYIAMLFIPPQVMVVLAALGFTDSWIDFRARIARRSSGPE